MNHHNGLPSLRLLPERYYRDWYSPHVNDPTAEIQVADAVFSSTQGTLRRCIIT